MMASNTILRQQGLIYLLFYYLWIFNESVGVCQSTGTGKQINPLQVLQGKIVRTGANALRAKGEFFTKGSSQLYGVANRINPRQIPNSMKPSYTRPTTILFDNNQSELLTPDESNQPNPVNPTNQQLVDLMQLNPMTFSRLQELMKQRQKLLLLQQQIDALRDVETVGLSMPLQQPQKVKQLTSGTCDQRLSQLIGDIFMGNEIIPQILESPPDHPLELTYRTQRTFPGMKLTADATKFKPILNWPTEGGALYSLILSNLDINSRANRSMSEFYHWFVANIPGTSIDDGDEIFQLLSPLVLPENGGDHRFGYFVMKQPGKLDYSEEGGPTANCGPTMANGRGPKRSTKDFIRKYGLRLTAATFVIIDHNEASIELACQWQSCMDGEVFLDDLDCSKFS